MALLCFVPAFGRGAPGEEFAVPLPEGVKAVWDLDKAHHETTPTRERICLNGLWRWQPAESDATRTPGGGWGYFKVPGCWPGITDYMQKDSQTVYAHPTWNEGKIRSTTAAWYEREITVPRHWAGRQVTVRLEYLNSLAIVYLDGQRAGEVRFPGGEVDLSGMGRAGGTHRLSLHVVALPLKGVMLSYTDTAAAREVKGSVERRGLCGDVYLVGAPTGARITDVKVDPSVRRRELAIEAGLEGLVPSGHYRLRARVTPSDDRAREFSSSPFTATQLGENGRLKFAERWRPKKLWDIHTSQHTCTLELSLVDGDGRELDACWPERFGFREFWIDGRDFYLNGRRLFLSAVPFDNAQVGAAQATYRAARESLERLQSFGINFVYTHNYGCEPGAHLGFTEILRAADDTGMLLALSQPHFSHYEWPTPDADRTNNYARHAAFYVRAAQNHPAVVMYAMSHNATGYNEDMNPEMIDGIQDARDSWALRNVRLAQRAEAIVTRLDPARIVYHHASGNLGPMHPINFYPNWAPIQELSDWFEPWATRGIKPVFLCEYGAPFTWDWTMYRGWYRGQREFGSARVPWEFCLAEWNAQFLGDRAFPASEREQANLRWEARQFRAGNRWHRWDYPSDVGSSRFTERYPVFAAYLTDNWRAFRTWGVSAISPWEHGHFWRLREGMDRSRRTLPVDWDSLQRPGFSPDYLAAQYERIDLAFERSDWIATPAAEALFRNNRPLLAYLAGKAARFTSKDHNFLAGDTVEKQIVIINNSRETVPYDARWSFALPRAAAGRRRGSLGAGQQERVALRFALPRTLPPGQYHLDAKIRFGNGETQEDTFAVSVLPSPPVTQPGSKIALFDPRGETAAWLDRQGLRHHAVGPEAELSGYDLLIVGKEALSLSGPAPDIRRVRDGLKVILFEQTAAVLEQRFGFRVAEYGLRQVFPRVPDHAALRGITVDELRDWRGEATILAPRLAYELNPKFSGAPTVSWCGMPVTRLWRCGNRGNVASVLIEKPPRGSFLPILAGGYSLQYSPLLEYREGRGLVLFCQLDVTGRTENDPAAETIARNLLLYAADWMPAPPRRAVYVGEPGGGTFLESIGVAPIPFEGRRLLDDDVLVIGPGGGPRLIPQTAVLADWLKAGGRILALGLAQEDLRAVPQLEATVRETEHISTGFAAFGHDSLFAGVGPADVHIRDPRELPLVSDGARVIGNGVLAEQPGVVYCQLLPWQFEATNQMNLKRTHRRVSFLLSRLLSNLGVAGSTPLLDRFHRPVDPAHPERRWLEGFYLDQPEEWDDPYRFFRW
jgi:hypothetical protein